MKFTAADLLWQAPVVLLTLTALLLILAESFATGRRRFLMGLTVAGCVLAAAASIAVWRQLDGRSIPIMGGMLIADGLACFFMLLFSVVAALTALASPDYQREHDFELGEYYGVLALSATGMAILAMANDLVSVFIGVETMSLGAYVLTASRRRSARAAEGAMKYFLMGAFATGVLLYGIALVYGAAGTTNLTALAGMRDALGGEILPFGSAGWASLFAVIAAATMTVGNLAALRQDNVKRMLAYSSIAHAGTMLVGVVAMGMGAPGAKAALLYYVVAYSITTVGAFAVVGWIGRRNEERLLVDDWAGLAARHPGAALAMTVFLLSLGGIPPIAGFFGKLYVFKSAMAAPDGQLTWLVIVGVLNSVAAIFYYLRVVTAMYFRDAVRPHDPMRSATTAFVFTVCALLIVEMGLLPGWWLARAG